MSEIVDLEKIKRCDIVQVAVSLGLPVKSNKTNCFNSSAHSNGDRTPSLSFDLETNRFKCFGCNISGDVIDLVATYKSVNFKSAVEYLGGQDTLKKLPVKKINNPVDGKTYSEIYELFFQTINNGLEVSDRAYKYCIEKRGFRDSILGGFVKDIEGLDHYNRIMNVVRNRYSKNDIRLSGIDAFFKYAHDNIPFLVYPFYDHGKIVYLIARRIDSNDHPKKLNLKGISPPLFNIDTLSRLEKGSDLYITEGIEDALILYTEACVDVIGVMGVNCIPNNIADLCKDFNVILAFDNDKAGREAKNVVSMLFLSSGQTVEEFVLPDGLDATDYHLKGGSFNGI
ncbi:MAG: hypothetical protein COA79_23120 [Planctomycetota bacterium]|nr:MAG: hypothetical protein COA79_23120 [Planctomycetota bacterium]